MMIHVVGCREAEAVFATLQCVEKGLSTGLKYHVVGASSCEGEWNHLLLMRRLRYSLT